MLDILRPFFPGDWAPYGESLRVAAVARPSVAQWLSDASELDAALARHAKFLDGARERKAVASDWTNRYFSALLPPIVAIATLLRRSVPMDWHEMALDLNEHGAPVAFIVSHIGSLPRDTSTSMRYDSLLWRHLAPLIALLGAKTQLPARILWGNAHRTLTAIFDSALPLVDPDPSLAQALLEDRRQLLESRTWCDGRRHPLFLRQRRVPAPLRQGVEPLILHASCCLAYRLPHALHCHACPLSPEHRNTGARAAAKEMPC